MASLAVRKSKETQLVTLYNNGEQKRISERTAEDQYQVSLLLNVQFHQSSIRILEDKKFLKYLVWVYVFFC